MTGILSRKASTPFSGSSNPPAGRRQLSPSEYGAMVVAGLPPESNALLLERADPLTALWEYYRY